MTSNFDPSDTRITFDDNYGSSIVYDDVEAPKLSNMPVAPTQQEIEDHNVNHLPFRSWCKHCVRGRSKAHAHKLNDSRISDVAVVSIDYKSATEEECLILSSRTEILKPPKLVLSHRKVLMIMPCADLSKPVRRLDTRESFLRVVVEML